MSYTILCSGASYSSPDGSQFLKRRDTDAIVDSGETMRQRKFIRTTF
jgi:hypothetical protein